MTAPATRPLRIGTAVRRSVKSVGAFEQYGVEASPERQQHDILDWIKRNAPAGTVVVEFEEDGYSAWEVKGEPRKKRPEFEREIATIEAGRLDLMVHWKVDRAARGYTNGHRLWRACQPANTRLVFVNDGLDSEHPMFEQMYFWMLGMALEYSKRISAGLIQYREALKRAGVRAPTRRRFGWAPDGLTPLEADVELTWKVRRKPPEGGPPVLVEVKFEPEATLLREAGEWLVADKPHLPRAEQHSIRRIINDWNGRGVLTAYGRPWTNVSFRRVFSAPYNEVIFGPELHAEIQAVLTNADRRRDRGWRRGSERVHLQTGRIFHDDPDCGERLYGWVGAPARARGIARYGRCGCGTQITRLTQELDALLLDDLMYRLECRAVEKGLARASADGEHRDLPAEKQRKKARQERLEAQAAALQEADDYETDPEAQAHVRVKIRAMAQLQTEMDDIDRQIREQQDQLHDDQLVEEAIKLGPALRSAWKTWTPQQRRDLLEAAGWERTNVRTGKRHARRLDPWTVDRHWRKRNGELEIIAGPSPGALPPPTCTVVDQDGPCDRPCSKGQDKCRKHLWRQRRHGDPTKVLTVPPPLKVPKDPPPGWPSDAPHCTAPGCDRPRKSRMPWCTLHYRRWRQTGDPLGKRRPGPRRATSSLGAGL
jgi:DNA invertase Pin-like site-specific DNA recombinase